MRACLLLLIVLAAHAADSVTVSARLQAIEPSGTGLTLRIVVLDVAEDAPLRAGALLTVAAPAASADDWQSRLAGLHRLELERVDGMAGMAGKPAWRLRAYRGVIIIEDPNDLPQIDTPEPREFARRAHELALREEGLLPDRTAAAGDGDDAPPQPAVDDFDRLLGEVENDPGLVQDEAAWQRFLGELRAAGEAEPVLPASRANSEALADERRRHIDAILGWQPPTIPSRPPNAAASTESAPPAKVAVLREPIVRVIDSAEAVLVLVEDGALEAGQAQLRRADSWQPLRVLASDGRYAVLSMPDAAPAVGERLRVRQASVDAP